MNSRKIIIIPLIFTLMLLACRFSVSTPVAVQEDPTADPVFTASPIPSEVETGTPVVIQTATQTVPATLTPSPLPPTNTPPPMPENQIAFINQGIEESANTIYLMNPDGTNKRPLSVDPSLRRVKDFSWSSDGRQIAISADPDNDNNNDIYIVNANGTEFRLLAKTEEDDRSPTWSPNRRWVTFISGGRKLYLANVEEIGWKPILDTYLIRDGESIQIDLNIRDVSWSPDSRWIGVATGDIDYDIYMFNPQAGGEATPISELRFLGENFPSWSPDGNIIAYSADTRLRSRSDIYLLDTRPGQNNPIRMTHHESFWPIQPNWSPDGKFIIYVVNREEGRNIYRLDVESGNVIQLTGASTQDEPESNEVYNDYPTLSPDGQFVAFESNRDGIYPQIFRIDVDGTNLVNLTNDNQSTNTFPAWQP